MTTGQSFRPHPTSCPRSTFTASERRWTRGNKALGRADWDTVCAGTRKTPPRREKAGGRGKAWCSPGRQQHATHEPLISRAMREEVPLAGLSSSWDPPVCLHQPVRCRATPKGVRLLKSTYPKPAKRDTLFSARAGGRCKRDGSSGRTAASALPRCLRHPKTRPVQCGSAACRASGMQSACWLLHPPGFSSGTITGQPGNSWGMPATSVTNRG